nr:MAG TPA: hypothetical protein [Caudoviricetes sp.]
MSLQSNQISTSVHKCIPCFIQKGIVNLSEVLRIRSVHPGATLPHPLPSCDPRQRFQGN